MTLAELKIGKEAKVLALHIEGVQRRRMLDIGMVPGARIVAVRKSPVGDPVAYEIKGALIGLRKEETQKVIIEEMN